MKTDSSIATVRPCVNTEQSARNDGRTSWIEAMSERMPPSTSHLIAEPIRRSSGQRPVVSVAVTSAEALVGAVIIAGKSFLGAVLPDGELHRAVDRELDDAGLLIDPAVGRGLLGLLRAEVTERLLAAG